MYTTTIAPKIAMNYYTRKKFRRQSK